jgi:hypothetical protein
MKPSNASEKHIRAIAERFEALLLTLPRIRPSITTPAMGSVNGSHGERLSARRRSCVPVPPFGPVVEIARVTVVAPEPAAICVEVACPVLKTQLAFVNVGSGGAKAQLNVTAPPKVDPLVGVAVKLEVAATPASTAAGAAGVDNVKVGAVTVSVSAADVLPELFKSPA